MNRRAQLPFACFVVVVAILGVQSEDMSVSTHADTMQDLAAQSETSVAEHADSGSSKFETMQTSTRASDAAENGATSVEGPGTSTSQNLRGSTIQSSLTATTTSALTATTTATLAARLCGELYTTTEEPNYLAYGATKVVVYAYIAAAGVTFGFLCVALYAKRANWEVDMTTKRKFYTVELFDLVLEGFGFVVAFAAEDFDFHNDAHDTVWNHLLYSVIFSGVLFVLEGVVLGCMHRYEIVSNWVLTILVCAHFGFEDVFQASLYSFVAEAQAKDQHLGKSASAALALILTLVTCLAKVVCLFQDMWAEKQAREQIAAVQQKASDAQKEASDAQQKATDAQKKATDALGHLATIGDEVAGYRRLRCEIWIDVLCGGVESAAGLHKSDKATIVKKLKEWLDGKLRQDLSSTAIAPEDFVYPTSVFAIVPKRASGITRFQLFGKTKSEDEPVQFFLYGKKKGDDTGICFCEGFGLPAGFKEGQCYDAVVATRPDNDPHGKLEAFSVYVKRSGYDWVHVSR